MKLKMFRRRKTAERRKINARVGLAATAKNSGQKAAA
jgi:hypothetical protein